ncbi:hypothetical protein C8R42DRAFT_640787 [Lentinula raphanica]|nr:hypothetical protein C8R42DRAFT_640787 [Lentinula raphanica]
MSSQLSWSSPLSVDELKLITRLSLSPDIRIGLLRGTIKLKDISTNDILPAVSSNNVTTLSESSASVPLKESQHMNVSESSTTRQSKAVKQQPDLTFSLFDSVIRMVNELKPFTGSISERAMLWNQVYQGYLDEGGNPGRNIEWLKNQVNEALDQHEGEENLVGRTSLAGSVGYNQTSPGELLILSRRLSTSTTAFLPRFWRVLHIKGTSLIWKLPRRVLDAVRYGISSLQITLVELANTAIGKQIRDASLAAFRRTLPRPPRINSVPNVETVSDDDIMILGDDGEFHPFHLTAASASSLNKKEEQINVPGTSTVQTLKRSRSEDDQARRKTRVEARKGKKIRTTLQKPKSNAHERSMRATEDLLKLLKQTSHNHR